MIAYWFCVYMMVGAFGKITRFFAFEVLHSDSGTENEFYSLILTMLAWPVPFVFFVKANLLDE